MLVSKKPTPSLVDPMPSLADPTPSLADPTVCVVHVGYPTQTLFPVESGLYDVVITRPKTGQTNEPLEAGATWYQACLDVCVEM